MFSTSITAVAKPCADVSYELFTNVPCSNRTRCNLFSDNPLKFQARPERTFTCAEDPVRKRHSSTFFCFARHIIAFLWLENKSELAEVAWWCTRESPDRLAFRVRGRGVVPEG
ncbi:hypothetical protein J6590_002824 [Homalodisca vitripennis]|nr:hypothetical protein J6590_002824 [Homalodisca vitripennis]